MTELESRTYSLISSARWSASILKELLADPKDDEMTLNRVYAHTEDIKMCVEELRDRAVALITIERAMK